MEAPQAQTADKYWLFLKDGYLSDWHLNGQYPTFDSAMDVAKRTGGVSYWIVKGREVARRDYEEEDRND